MKSFFKSLALLLVVNCMVALVPQQAAAQYNQVVVDNQPGYQGNYREPNEQVFYDELAPDGQWVNHPNYGYVWIPNAEPEFAPYRTSGHWVLTDYGWTWVSDYRWGWACFHYGRWEFDQYYGWLWLPGHEWAPAWVSWRRCPGYYGWAPMGYHHTVEMVYGDNYYVDNDRWVFVDERYVDDPYCSRYYAPRENNYMYVRNGNYIDNRYSDNERHVTYIAGPRRDEVERVTYHPVNRVVVRDSDRPGQTRHEKNEVTIYRPVVQKHDEKQNLAPRNVVAMDKAKPVNQRHDEYKQQHPEYHGTNVRTDQNQQKTNDVHLQNNQQQENHLQNNNQEKHIENNQQNIDKSRGVQDNQQQNFDKTKGVQEHQVNQNQNQQQQVKDGRMQQGNPNYNNNTKTNKQVPVDKNQQKTDTKRTDSKVKEVKTPPPAPVKDSKDEKKDDKDVKRER